MKHDNTIILGAGLAGLGCARALPGARVFEAAPHPGGHAYSHEVDGVFFDQGAHICHAKDPDWLKLLYECAGEVEQIGASRISNHWNGHWVGYPVQNNLSELPHEARVEALKGFVQALSSRSTAEPANYLEWCRTQYGDYLTDQFYRLYTDKYWRVPMEKLATDWLGGRLLPSQIGRIIEGALGKPRESQAVFARFQYPARGGFYSFFKSLFEALPAEYNMRVVEVDANRKEVVFENGEKEAYQRLASSIPLPVLVRAIKDVPSAMREAAACLRHVQLLCVNMIIERDAGCEERDEGGLFGHSGLRSPVSGLTPYHWFYIYDEDVDVARVKVNSNVAPQSVPEGRTALQCEIFRRMDEPMDMGALTEKAVKDMGGILGFDPERDVVEVKPVHVPYAYVISDLNRAHAVNTIIPWLESQGIISMGLFGRWQFIWSDAAYRSGEKTAGKIREVGGRKLKRMKTGIG